ncbi:hypothetical protein DXG01_000312 [Tephrocybe rancida]|nr:hypothetical protein DXG01_000312 [Tephrocybe rancida]
MTSQGEYHTILNTIDGTEVNGNTAKIWTTYNTEAAKEDEALGKSITEDMNSMLLFAGLFAATVTAFLIESYRNLKPDPNVLTNALLARISLQLEQVVKGPQASTDATLPGWVTSLSDITNISSPPPFQPTNTNFACNMSMFLSLLSCLGCALGACLAQQWARCYVEMAKSYTLPADRGRMRTYLYHGLDRFNMKSIVAFIPMLLHASLFLFFGGLVLFLFPVNIMIGSGALVIVVALVVFYAVFTLLPLVYSDCPYNTPLSSWCWYGVNSLRQTGYLPYLGVVERLVIPDEDLRQAAYLNATGKSTKRDERDGWAMQVAVNTLHHDGLLLDFLESYRARKSPNERQKSQIVSLLGCTDLVSRFNTTIMDFKTMMSNERSQHIVACLLAAADLYRYTEAVEYKEDLAPPRCPFDGEIHMAAVFAAYTDILLDGKEVVANDGGLSMTHHEMKCALGKYAFRLLWRALLRLSDNARTLHEAMIQLRPPAATPQPATPSPNMDGHATQLPSDTRNKELRALVETQQEELAGALKLFGSGELEPIKFTYPYLDKIAEGWNMFSILLGRTRERLNNYPAPLTQGYDNTIDNTISEYQDLRIHIHYLQILALFHSAGNCFTQDLAKEYEWARCDVLLRERAKELSGFDLKFESQAKLGSLLQYFCEQRLYWPYRGCRNSLNRTKIWPEVEINEVYHLENASLLLLANIKGRWEIGRIVDVLEARIKSDEAPGPARDEFLRKATDTQADAKAYQRLARGKVIHIAQILDKAAQVNNSFTSLLEGGTWPKLRNDYRDHIR